MGGPSSTSDAAVIIILSNDDDAPVFSGKEKILLTQRADSLREHAGEVAFPGGKRDLEDKDLYHTALRECHEEVGLHERYLRYLDQLPLHFTRRGGRVAPFVAEVRTAPELVLNPEEIDSAFWAPVSLFIEDCRSCTHIFSTAYGEYWAPVYHYEGYKIWGFTARVLVSFVNQLYGAGVERAHSKAPETIFR